MPDQPAMAHRATFDCLPRDAQCTRLNEMLMRRPLIVTNEHLVNNVFWHYLVGFLIIYTCVRVLSLNKKAAGGGGPRAARRANVAPFALKVLLGAAVGWVFADLLSFLMHMTIDSDAWQRALIRGGGGPAVVDDHHAFTLNYSYMNGVELFALSYPVTVPLIVVLCTLHFLVFPGLLASPFYVAFFASTVALTLACGYTHKWAHERTHGLLDCAAVSALQDARIFLPPREHQMHHAETDDRLRRHFNLSSGVVDRVVSFFAQQRRTAPDP